MAVRRVLLCLAYIGSAVALAGGCDAGLPLPLGAGPTSGLEGDTVADELIVAARPGAKRDEIIQLCEGVGATVLDEVAELSMYRLRVAQREREAVRASLMGMAQIEGVLDNRVYTRQTAPNDPEYWQQWHLDAIRVAEAWAIATGSEAIPVAVLDTGIDRTHVDLVAKVGDGWNVQNSTGDISDLLGHGTAVAGLIGATTDNGIGIASVARNNPILAIRVTDEAGRATSWVLAAGIRAAMGFGARVINISFAPLYDDRIVLGQAELAMLRGALVLASAGNSGMRVDAGETDAVVFVGAVDRQDQLAAFSTHGDFLDLVAPGVNVLTTASGGGYTSLSGTSFSAPLVSGVAALAWSANPDLRPLTIRRILTSTARNLGTPGWNASFGQGCVDAAAAVRSAQLLVEATDSTKPTVMIQSPLNEASISKATPVEVWASDNDAVAEVVLLLNGVAVAADAVRPCSFALDPVRFSTGTHPLTARAFDMAGSWADASISVTFGGATDSTRPTVNIISPRDGATVRGIVSIIAEAKGDRSLRWAEILVDDRLITVFPCCPTLRRGLPSIGIRRRPVMWAAGTGSLSGSPMPQATRPQLRSGFGRSDGVCDMVGLG
ncbi:MAG: S8 family serine peptidase [Phycisphaerae bacterium]|nr:S8 family serine peptidase [Phycisphaerae bacterium]